MNIFQKIKEKLNPKTEIKFSEIDSWLSSREKEIQNIKDELEPVIKEKLREFSRDLDEKINILKKVSIEERKENARTKHIVDVNLKQYIRHAEKLLNLDFEKLNFDELNELINTSFSEFAKNSYANYQKATYLVGKEIGNVNELIKKFLSDYSKAMKRYHDQKPEMIKKIRNKKFDDTEIKALNQEISAKQKEIDSLKKEIKSYEAEISKIKKSKDYAKNLELSQEKNKLDSEITKDISALKQSIDFKFLSKIFHQSPLLKVVKEFRENFYHNFKSDQKKLIHLIEEAKINKSLLKKIESINEKEKRKNEINTVDETKSIAEKIKLLKSEIESEESKIEKLSKKEKVLLDEKTDFEKSIIDDLKKLDLIIKH